jgi:methyl-accepting chemotaxis protein
VRKAVDEQMKLFNERFDDFSKTQDEKTLAMLPTIKETMAAYERGLENTLRLASETKDVQLSDQVERLRASAMSSQIVATKLRSEMRTVAEQLGSRVDHFAKLASDEYQATSRQLMIIAAAGIIFGMLAGFLIGQFGIVKPVVLLKAVMEAFARNDLKAEVPGTERRDELGDMARTVEVFKKNGLEVERMRADQQVTQKRNAEQRKTDMIKLADDFEGAVGEIIETVSSASTELEASAGTLTSTAVRSQELTTMVAAASEEASM